MKNRRMLLLGLIAAAAGSYVIGFMPGFGIFVLLGMCFELMFWFRLFKPKSQN